MRNKLYKSILLFACLFISTTVINAATGSGSGALVNIRNTIIGRSSSKVAGYYNTTYTQTTESIETLFSKYYDINVQNEAAISSKLWDDYHCKAHFESGSSSNATERYCVCTLQSKNTCKIKVYAGGDEGRDYYKVTVTGAKKHTSTKSGTAGTYIHHYTITNSTGSSSSNAYCIQPSKQWPGSSSYTSLNYTLNRTVDVRKCKSIGDRSIGYSCGLAEIFYQAKKGTMSKLSDENEYYNVIGAALRMWVVYWYKFTNYRNMAGIEQESVCGEAGEAGAECVTGNEYASKPVYYNTVNAVLMGYTGSSCKNVSKKYGNGSNHGILCWNNNNSKEYVTDIIELFNYVRLHQNDKIQDNRFGAVDDSFDIKTYIKEKQKINSASKQTKWNMTIDVRVDENVKKQIIAKCNPKDDSNCRSIIEVIDAYGESIGYCKDNDINEGKSCYRINFNDPDYTVSGKDSYLFTFKVYNYKVCVLTNKEGQVGLYLTKPGITFHLKGGVLGFATVRQYIHSSSPAGRQVMMTYIDDYKKFDGAEVNIPGKALEYHFPFDLSDISCDPNDSQNCDPNKNCTSLDKQTDIKGNDGKSNNVSDVCEGTSNDAGKEFSYRTIEDPQMSCIINNCDTAATEEYDVTNKVNANPAFCKVYCRDEVRFYIPSPTSVLAGMQFRFDLGKSLIQYGAIDKQVKDDKKLTAVVVRYKQCTSVFNKSAYDALDNSDKDKDKEYCLMNADLQNKLINPDSNGFSYDSNKEPIKLTATYEEGNKIEIKSEYKKTKESLTYCKNDCYRVNKTATKTSCEANLNNFTTTKPSIGNGDVIYSTLLIRVQNDYYVGNQFSYEPITGKVSMNNRTTKIPKYSYPVSIEAESGTYNINYKFTNISKDSSTGYDTLNYGCYYTVYNTTKKNDCGYTKDGKVDFSMCSNACYEIDEEGNAVIDKNCINWESSNKHGLGLSYRNVSLKNLFPVARGSRSNWYYKEEVNNPFAIKNGIIVNSEKNKIKVGDLIEKTQEIGNNIYNKDHLESSYYLSTETIKKIKKYNKDNGNTYLNDTANNCIKISRVSGGAYYRCGSSFLDELKNNYNAKVGGN